MTLRELMTAIHLQETHHWTVNGEGWPGVPYMIQRMNLGRYKVFVRVKDSEDVVMIFAAQPTKSADPLDAELR